MKALVKYEDGSRKLKLMVRPKPNAAAGQAVVRVRYAGICGTDIHIFLDDGGYHTNPPVILGHEFSGVVDSVGDGVCQDLIGKRVISETYFHTCGHCRFCESGYPNLCSERLSIGSGVDGAMAEWVVVPAHKLHVLPQEIDMAEAAMVEPLACCTQAVLEKGNLRAGDRVLITGPGAIGMMCAELALACGAEVTLAGMHADAHKLEVARQLGVQHTVFSDDADAEAQILEKTQGDGADIVFECSGAGAAIAIALRAVRKGGRMVQVGLSGKPVALNMNLIVMKDLSVIGTFAQKPIWWTRAIELLRQKQLNLNRLISGIYPLEHWEEAFDAYRSCEGFKYLFEL